MALTKTVTKLWPVLEQDGRTYRVGINLILLDDGVEKINANFIATYGGVGQLSVAQSNVLIAAQKAIDKYKSEKTTNDAPVYTNSVAAIDAALVL